jgi:outer membrane protein TolC
MNLNRNAFSIGLAVVLLAGTGMPQEATDAPQPPQAPPPESGTVELRLQQAIEMALANNLDVVVSRLETQVQAEGVNAARGVYRPLLSAGFNTLDSRSPAQNQLIGATVLASTRTNYDFSWGQQLATGGNYNVAWQNLRSTQARSQQTAHPGSPKRRASREEPVRDPGDGYGA